MESVRVSALNVLVALLLIVDGPAFLVVVCLFFDRNFFERQKSLNEIWNFARF